MKQNFICDFDYPVVETECGKLRGYFLNDLYHFRGVPYGKAERFMLPTPADTWKDVRPAYTYGPNPPVINRPRINAFDPGLQFRYWPESENCLTLNIWTPEINGSADKPVMVWIHGGGLESGSATELIGYEADRLCRDEDIVVVSVNHRLNLLGYMNLTDFGEQYAHTGTLGMMDLVEALRWIKENIAPFGGNPKNITIVGHSGGGAKVRSLMQMPEAGKYYDKAIIHSGVRYKDNRFRPAEEVRHDSAVTADALVRELGLDKGSIRKIEKIPYSQLARAFRKIAPALTAAGVDFTWSPVPDEHFPGDYTNVGLSEKAKKTPMIVGTTFGEMNLDKGIFYDRAMGGEEVDKVIADYYGQRGGELSKMFKKSFPYKDKLDLLYMDSVYRIGSTDFLQERTKQGGAPSYMFLLSYNFKMFGGFPAWHGSDLPCLFKSYDRIPVYNEPGAQEIGELFSGYLAAFVRNGKPEKAGAPEWREFTREKHDTMVIDENTGMSGDISYDMMKLHNEICPGFTFDFSSEADDN